MDAEPKNKDENKTSGLKFDGLDGFKNGEFACAKFDAEKTSLGVAWFLNLTLQTKGKVNFSSNLVSGVKFADATKNANLMSVSNLSHKQSGTNLNAEFDAVQILLAANCQTVFAKRDGRADLTQKAVLAKAQNV